ncbi:hypothetical protein ACRE1U_04420 [Helicobacter himalayensis]|uniref:hypothetical protein n=1 Tax=Helicobacter himalayensis TaxID=1591088 RepID=UPI003D6DB110
MENAGRGKTHQCGVRIMENVGAKPKVWAWIRRQNDKKIYKKIAYPQGSSKLTAQGESVGFWGSLKASNSVGARKWGECG